MTLCFAKEPLASQKQGSEEVGAQSAFKNDLVCSDDVQTVVRDATCR